MTRIEVKPKPRKDSASAIWQTEDGSQVFIGRNYALQNEIDEKLAQTRARGCFRGCHTCGACANSKRDNFDMQYERSEDGLVVAHGPTKSYDSVNKEWVDCVKCEPFRFHDCHNGVFRDQRQEAEPFTEEQQKLLDQSGGRPLI